MIIGKFTKDGNGYTGELTTLTHRQTLKFEPLTEKKVDYVITAEGVEVGAGWKRTARETGRVFYSVRLDDPSFPAPIYASLVEVENGYALIWSRPDR